MKSSRQLRMAALLVLGLAFRALARETILQNTAEEPWRIATIQTQLARQGFSCGLADNRAGVRTRGALEDFMEAKGLASEADAWKTLQQDAAPLFGRYAIRAADRAALGRAPKDWLEASREPSLAYESLPELLSELFAMAEPVVHTLNPGVDWSTVTAGVEVAVFNWRAPRAAGPAARVEIDPEHFRLRVYDTNGVLFLSFPCSVAREQAKIPVGDLTMVVFAKHPDYTFKPSNYPGNPRAREIGRPLVLPPGPNNPVGVYWMGLNKPGFGIHGTPHPESIGSMESHGCFRLTNRDILTLSRYVRSGLPVSIRAAARPAADGSETPE